VDSNGVNLENKLKPIGVHVQQKTTNLYLSQLTEILAQGGIDAHTEREREDKIAIWDNMVEE
ncbi:hypothetical protein KI387_037579, partial [Taxus chinensis]